MPVLSTSPWLTTPTRGLCDFAATGRRSRPCFDSKQCAGVRRASRASCRPKIGWVRSDPSCTLLALIALARSSRCFDSKHAGLIPTRMGYTAPTPDRLREGQARPTQSCALHGSGAGRMFRFETALRTRRPTIFTMPSTPAKCFAVSNRNSIMFIARWHGRFESKRERRPQPYGAAFRIETRPGLVSFCQAFRIET